MAVGWCGGCKALLVFNFGQAEQLQVSVLFRVRVDGCGQVDEIINAARELSQIGKPTLDFSKSP